MPRHSSRTVLRTVPHPGPLQIDQQGGPEWLDFADCHATHLLPGDSHDPEDWAEAMFGREWPVLVQVLMRVRIVLGKLLRLDRGVPPEGSATVFPVVAASPEEVVLSLDDKHLTFWVGLRTDGGYASVTTTVRTKNLFGKAYKTIVVGLFHPYVVKMVLKMVPAPLQLASSE